MAVLLEKTTGKKSEFELLVFNCKGKLILILIKNQFILNIFFFFFFEIQEKTLILLKGLIIIEIFLLNWGVLLF